MLIFVGYSGRTAKSVNAAFSDVIESDNISIDLMDDTKNTYS
jgi:hypothetical protein